MRQNKVEFGDWQTPLGLAQDTLALVKKLGPKFKSILEPTCGEGAFLVAASECFPHASLVGLEVNPQYADAARAQLPSDRARVETADFFEVLWERELASLPGPLLVMGNPPWVTSSQLGVLGSGNLPQKQNFKGLSGYDALTGKSNFDVSEWMILRLLQALADRPAMMAFLCKSAVARRIVEFVGQRRFNVAPGGLWRIDAKQHFDASVDAVLFICRTVTSPETNHRWPVYSSLDAEEPESWLGVVDGVVVGDADAYLRTRHLVGECEPEWRSGVKHDCSRVMEVHRDATGWINGLNEAVDIEPEFVFPLLKSSDVANERLVSSRGVVLPQRTLGQSTQSLRELAPKAWAYLSKHRSLLEARKSSIYKGQPDFAVFGIGDYTFAPWKVAVSGLYKRFRFALVGPQDGRPVVFDDTCYFLPFDDRESASAAADAMRSAVATDFLSSRIFWDAKRPISKAILQTLDLHALQLELGFKVGRSRKPNQQVLAL